MMTKSTLKDIFKYLFLFSLGGQTYYTLEVAWRGWSHWSMWILGGLCFLMMGLVNEIFSWKTPLIYQMIIGGFTTTVMEFITGCTVNLWLGWDIWDYSDVPYNLMGQICLRSSVLWCFISLIGIILDDWCRYLFFGEEKPRYKIF